MPAVGEVDDTDQNIETLVRGTEALVRPPPLLLHNVCQAEDSIRKLDDLRRVRRGDLFELLQIRGELCLAGTQLRQLGGKLRLVVRKKLQQATDAFVEPILRRFEAFRSANLASQTFASHSILN